MRIIAWTFCALMTGALITPDAVRADSFSVPINDHSWRNLKVPGQDENRFSLTGQELRVSSDTSVSFRYVEFPKSTGGVAQVSWQWRVDTHSELSSQVEKGRDDRPLAVHVWFDDATDTSLFGRFARIFGYPKIGHLMTYVWGAREEAGSVLVNPHYRKGRVIVLEGQGGQTGQWQSVQRDIARDFRAAFGTEPDLSALRYLAVSADSDDLQGHSEAAVRAIAFRTP